MASKRPNIYSNEIDHELEATDGVLDLKVKFEITTYPEEPMSLDREYPGCGPSDELTELQVSWRGLDVKPVLSALELAQVTKSCYYDFTNNA